jgi:hypothetical protein
MTFYFLKPKTIIVDLTAKFDILCINKLCQIGEDAYVYVNYHIKKRITNNNITNL